MLATQRFNFITDSCTGDQNDLTMTDKIRIYVLWLDIISFGMIRGVE